MKKINLKIRKSLPEDLDRIMEIYEIARDFMKKTGNPNQWGPTNWPPRELIENDIELEKSYVCVNGENRILGTFFFIHGTDIEPKYCEITEGSWIDDSAYGVIHRLATDGSQKGIGTFCINWAYDQCKHIRIDTHGDNIAMQKLVEKLGFIHCGTIYVNQDNYPRLAYEKSDKTSKHHH